METTDRNRTPGGLALGDEAEIVRLYREIRGLNRPMSFLDAEEIQRTVTVLGTGVDVALTIAVALLAARHNAPGLLWLTLLSPAAFFTASWFGSHARESDGRASSDARLWAIGPVGTGILSAKVAAWEQANRNPRLRIDPASLEVIEPVARHLARPILSEVSALRREAPSGAGLALAERRERRRDELRAQAARETDEAWRRAAEEHAERLDAEARTLREHHAIWLEQRERILADGAALEAYLARLGERLRLLREIGASRATGNAPLAAPDDRNEADELRTRISSLQTSLRAQEPLARERVEAELEMNQLEAR